MRIWNITNSGSLITTFLIQNDANFGPTALELLSDGTLACGNNWNYIQIWNMTTYTLIKNLYSSIASTTLLTLKSLWNGNLASGFADGTILIWNLVSYVQIVVQTPTLNIWYNACLDQLNDGSLVSGFWAKIQVWDSTNGSLYNTIPLSTTLTALKMLPNGNVVIGGWDGIVQIWQIGRNTGTMIKQLNYLIGGSIDYSGVLSFAIYDSQTFLTGYESGNIALNSQNSFIQSMGFKDLKSVKSLVVASKNKIVFYYFNRLIEQLNQIINARLRLKH
jgi:hypothetical protein